jgi:dTDP-4-amino-4,6-dideoxygalactose transaminase
LKYLEKWNAARRSNAKLYQEHLEGIGVVTPTEAAGAESVWHLYVIRTENRDLLRETLASKGISAGIHYPIPIHLQPAYKDLGHQRGDFPVTEAHAQRILSLPMYPELAPELIKYVARSIVTFLSENRDSQATFEQLTSHASPSP